MQHFYQPSTSIITVVGQICFLPRLISALDRTCALQLRRQFDVKTPKLNLSNFLASSPNKYTLYLYTGLLESSTVDVCIGQHWYTTIVQPFRIFFFEKNSPTKTRRRIEGRLLVRWPRLLIPVFAKYRFSSADEAIIAYQSQVISRARSIYPSNVFYLCIWRSKSSRMVIIRYIFN